MNRSKKTLRLTNMGVKPSILLHTDFLDMLASQELSPEENFLYAILERALMDLLTEQPGAMRYKRQAARWVLLAKSNVPQRGFSFIQIRDYLELSSDLVKRIRELALSVMYDTK